MADVEVPPEIVARLRTACLALPETSEEPAWTGTRWRARRRTFAHVVRIEGGWPPGYARAAGTNGPVTVLTFRSSGGELEALSHMGPPVLPAEVGTRRRGHGLDADVDWSEIAELVTESYNVMAPKKLAASVE
jgi:hypothetical protein